MNMEARLGDFFAEYAARFNRSLTDSPVIDVEATAGAFAGCFLEVSPLGANCGKNDEQFREMIPHGFEFYRSIGTKSMAIESVALTELTRDHWMARVAWNSFYVKKDGSGIRIDFEVIYFLQTLGGQPKIFAYITGDEAKVLKEHGLIPG